MDFELNPEQTQLRESLRRYLADRYSFEQRAALLKSSELDRARWSEFAELGLLAAGLPEDAGGWGGGAVDVALIMEEVGRSLVVEPLLENVVFATRLLLHSQLDERNALISALVSGETIYAVAFSEEAHDHFGAACQTVARLTASGYVLSGQKVMVGWAPSADRVLVTASLGDGERGLFLVEASAEGFSIDAYKTIDGRVAADVSMVELQVGSAALLLRGVAFEVALDDAIDHMLVGLCAESLGCMDAALELTARYLGDRQQFGRPLSEFQALQHRMADMFTETSMARSMTYQGLAALSLDRAARAKGVSAAKLRVDQASHFVGGNVVHNHGGIGFTEEYPAGHYFRRLVAIRQSLGDRAFHLKRYAEASKEV